MGYQAGLCEELSVGIQDHTGVGYVYTLLLPVDNNGGWRMETGIERHKLHYIGIHFRDFKVAFFNTLWPVPWVRFALERYSPTRHAPGALIIHLFIVMITLTRTRHD